MRMLSRCLCVIVLAGCASETPKGSFVQNDAGVIVTPADFPQRRVRLEARTDRTIRVTAVADESLTMPESLMVVPSATARPAFKVAEREGVVTLSTDRVVA